MSAEASTPRTCRGVPWATLLVAALACAAQWPGAAASLAFERDALAAHAWWRLWTGHVTHFSAGHLGWNLAPLLLFGGWAERLAPARMRAFLLLAPPLISGLLWLDPRLEEYRGLSGAVMGLVALVALQQLRRDRGPAPWLWPLALALLAAKLGWEMWRETAVFASFRADENIRVVPLAHVAGVAVATVFHLWPGRAARAERAVISNR